MSPAELHDCNKLSRQLIAAGSESFLLLLPPRRERAQSVSALSRFSLLQLNPGIIHSKATATVPAVVETTVVIKAGGYTSLSFIPLIGRNI